MDLEALWQKFLDGTSAPGAALGMAAAALVLSLALVRLVLRPLIGLLSSRDVEKVRASRVARITFALLMTSAALAVFVYLHATVAPSARPETLPFQFSLLLVFAGAGYAAFEIALTLFADTLRHLRGKPPITPIIKDMMRALAFLAILVAGLKEAFPKADIGAIMTTSAILSIVLGLALQESLSNVFAGLMLTVDRPYKPGEWVEVEGREGKVLDSNWRSTRILTRDDDVVYVPNSTMNKTTVLNLTAPTKLHRCRRKIGLEYGAPPNKVRSVLVSMMGHVEGVLKDPAPDVFLLDFDDYSVVYEMRFWIEDHERRPKIESEVMRAAWYHLKRNAISIPYPIRDVYLKRERPERRPEELLTLLRQVDILVPLKEPEQRMLAEDLTSELYARGEVVCRQGDPGSTFYIIKSGIVSVIVKGSDGIEAEVAQLKPGMYFGEMSLLTGDPRSSTCRALEDSELLCLDRDSFAVLLQENPPVAQAMSEILAARSAATQEKLSSERQTALRMKAVKDESGSKRILEKIWGIFGFRKTS